MRYRDFVTSIRNALDFLENVDLLQLRARVDSLPVSEQFKATALNENASYDEVYQAGMKESHYNTLLLDYAYFQYSFESSKSWRLAYYPSPNFSGVPKAQEELIDLRELEAKGVIGTEDFLDLVSEVCPAKVRVPMMRYEYNEKQHSDVKHPISHFHIGCEGEDRLAVRRKFSPLTFTMMIVRQFYSRHWWIRTKFDDPTIASCLETRLNSAFQADGAVQDFTVGEKLSLHLDAM